jgi:hypothetical protein
MSASILYQVWSAASLIDWHERGLTANLRVINTNSVTPESDRSQSPLFYALWFIRTKFVRKLKATDGFF